MLRAFPCIACLACLIAGCGQKDAASETSQTPATSPSASSTGAGATNSDDPITEVDMSELGVRLYPGAYTTATLGGVSKLEMDGRTTVTGRFFSPDAVDKIYDFYKMDLKEAGGLPPTKLAGAVIGKNANGDAVDVTIARDEETSRTAIIIEAKRR